jgi:site-specific DNA-methyltransferase (adenine-specific)
MGGVMLELNKIYNMDCLDGLKLLDDECIDLTVTSPPYDNLRTYNGYSFDFESIAKELYRVTKQGGVIVWVVGDQTINGSESGTSFRQALYFKEIGFNLHDTMIWEKNSSTFPANDNSSRYTQIFEYMFVLSKGKLDKSNLIIDKKNKWFGFKDFGGKLKKPVPEYSARNNIWKVTTSFNDKTNHPAVFPEQLVNDHILSWSNKDDIVMDIFMGSGTTAKMAIVNDRRWIGFEISKEYCDITNKRIDGLYPQLSIFD